MRYSISQAAEEKKLAAHTLRFYEREGLIKPKRSENGIRYFSDEDMNRLDVIGCLKGSGLSIKEIAHYFELCREGNSSLDERLKIFTERKLHIIDELEKMNSYLATVNRKIAIYNERIAKRDKGEEKQNK